MVKKILICEDEPYLRDIIASQLCSDGFTVVEALDGAECLNQLQMNHPDLMFLDINLPKINGFDVLSSMQRMGIKCPVIIITGGVNSSTLEKARTMGVKAVLKKPFNLDSLKQMLTSQYKTL